MTARTETPRILRTAALAAAVLLLVPARADAYIGPGAGFAFVSSFLVLGATFLLAFGTIAIAPFRALFRLLTGKNAYKNAAFERIVIVGLDGMDPGRAKRLMDEGKLPNFKALADEGVFSPLQTSVPSLSPIAWSSFTTGVDASRHNIFDFLTRDPCTYAPMLSSTDIGNVKKFLKLGKFRIPLGKPVIRLLRKSQPFWKILGENGVFSTIQRVPITFPAEKFKGHLLSGMCVPDLRGTQGTFSHFTDTDPDSGEPAHTGGEQCKARRISVNEVAGALVGPENSLVEGGGTMYARFTAVRADDAVTLTLGEEEAVVKVGEYTPWMRAEFKAGLGIKVKGIVRFLVQEFSGSAFSMYATPIQIDPEDPAMPISHPTIYSIYMARKIGPFATLGLAEDTWALNEGVLDEQSFLDQSWLIWEERKKMLFDALDKTRKGLVTTVFDTTDRIQHMFYRFTEPDHPALAGRDDIERWKDTIDDMYIRMDGMLAEIRGKCRPDDLLMVISDHGFCSFQRGFNVNAWLRDEGYLVLKEGTTSPDWFTNVDWSKTKAFALGLTGLFINRAGREMQGIVAEGAELEALKAEIKGKLEALVDPEREVPVMRRVFDTTGDFQGPYTADAPDLLFGYHKGYRHSWECAVGNVTEEAFSDNTKAWSGDHSVDPALVPGIFFCNKQIAAKAPSLLDIAPTVLGLFGIDPPGYMQGTDIFAPLPDAPPAPDAPPVAPGSGDEVPETSKEEVVA